LQIHPKKSRLKLEPNDLFRRFYPIVGFEKMENEFGPLPKKEESIAREIDIPSRQGRLVVAQRRFIRLWRIPSSL